MSITGRNTAAEEFRVESVVDWLLNQLLCVSVGNVLFTLNFDVVYRTGQYIDEAAR